MNQNPIYFTQISDWRNWLAVNYMQSEPIWLLFYKKKTNKPSLDYSDVVEQALCYGWIDGIIKGIDDKCFMRKFMPRVNFINWSESNRLRVEKLIKSGEMTEIGLAKIGNYATEGKLVWPEIKSNNYTQFSKQLLDRLKKKQTAFFNFSKLSLSQQLKYIQWVMGAKKEETQIKRLEEAILLLEKNVRNLIK